MIRRAIKLGSLCAIAITSVAGAVLIEAGNDIQNEVVGAMVTIIVICSVVWFVCNDLEYLE